MKRFPLSWSTRSGRARLYQLALLLLLVLVGWSLWHHTARSLADRQIRSGFGFLGEPEPSDDHARGEDLVKGDRFAQVIRGVTDAVRKLGPAKKLVKQLQGAQTA